MLSNLFFYEYKHLFHGYFITFRSLIIDHFIGDMTVILELLAQTHFWFFMKLYSIKTKYEYIFQIIVDPDIFHVYFKDLYISKLLPQEEGMN